MENSHAIALATATAAVALVATFFWFDRRAKADLSKHGFPALVGNTKMIKIRSLSEATGYTILAKVEFENPGGCQKDRVAKRIVEEAEAEGLLGGPNQTIVEGTSGSTGISLSLMARSRGYKCIIVMPDDMAQEKQVASKCLPYWLYSPYLDCHCRTCFVFSGLRCS
jgi:cysteine synthase A